MFERFTEDARQVVVQAQAEASALQQDAIAPEHLLLGLFGAPDGLATRALETLGVTFEGIRGQLTPGEGEHAASASAQLPFATEAKELLQLALREALSLGHSYVGTEHILLGLTRQHTASVVELLATVGADLGAVREKVIELIASPHRQRRAGVGEPARIVPRQGEDEAVWAVCSRCRLGSRVTADGFCLAHAPPRQRREALALLHEGTALDVRGVVLTARLLAEILAGAPSEDGHVVLTDARFDGAEFPAETSFERVVFDGASFRGAKFGPRTSFGGAYFRRGSLPDLTGDCHTFFDGAEFGEAASFVDALFEGGGVSFTGALFAERCSFDNLFVEGAALFARATIADEATFAGASFGDLSSFNHARLGRAAAFTGASFGRALDASSASFGDRVTFAGATCGDEVEFEDAAFGKEISFERAGFAGDASFRGAVFGDGATFTAAFFAGDSSFARAQFGENTRFGLATASGVLSLEQVLFGRGSEIELAAQSVECTGLKAPAGLTMRVHDADMLLDAAHFGAPSTVTGSADWFEAAGENVVEGEEEAREPGERRARILTLEGSDVQQLLLANVDLGRCRFASARNLDHLILERPISLPGTPRGFHAAPAMPPIWRWTPRETLSEEHEWRSATRNHAGWISDPASGSEAGSDKVDEHGYKRAIDQLRRERQRGS